MQATCPDSKTGFLASTAEIELPEQVTVPLFIYWEALCKQADLSFLLGKIKQPCLIIWGGEDKATPLIDAHFLNKGIEGSELKIISGARHNPYKTHPKETAEAIINFLNK